MATAVLRMKKRTKTTKVTTKATNESMHHTMTMHRTANLLKHLSDSTRLQVVSLLSEGERHVGGLCDDLTQRPGVMSHHLALLRTVESLTAAARARTTSTASPNRLSAFQYRERRGSLPPR